MIAKVGSKVDCLCTGRQTVIPVTSEHTPLIALTLFGKADVQN